MLSTTQKIKVNLYTIDQKKLILMASPSDQDDFTYSLNNFISSFIAQMNARFEIKQIKGACGQPYDSFIHAKTCYQEAQYTLLLQNAFSTKANPLYSYASLGIYQYIKTLYDSKKYSSFKRNIQNLCEYDSKNHTSLVLTLKSFLENDSDPYLVAKDLHLHVNTIHYRMKRIGEIGEINLKDPLQKMTLYIEFLLDKYEQFNQS